MLCLLLIWEIVIMQGITGHKQMAKVSFGISKWFAISNVSGFVPKKKC
jgi:hypothetical protein